MSIGCNFISLTWNILIVKLGDIYTYEKSLWKKKKTHLNLFIILKILINLSSFSGHSHMYNNVKRYSPCTMRTYSALLWPMVFVASHRYVPLSVLLRKRMFSSLPLTTIRSGSGNSPPSFVHKTGSGLLDLNTHINKKYMKCYIFCELSNL